MRRISLALAAILFATPAFAHTGVGATSGLAHGALHPIGGLDHVLAMVAVGLFAWRLGGRALWLVPLAFVAMMAVGGALGVFGVPVPYVETGIALSVVVIGAMVALGGGLPLGVAAAVVGIFAVFHGHAHGSEMPETLSGAAYGLGFMAATAFLHGVGILAGAGVTTVAKQPGAAMVRAGGAATSVAGLALLGGVL
ncbi:HupE/UreJ family protein [Roseospira marina]|uniref:HupE/UreJ family protein n=1 Tax=Roseospira marina TaxID=140057 RepID=A0A5M6IBS8_9PROT|nr:HupE/UreJ family protein [Roseospira marina]KAA5605744.1 HupE/UreJ family protein [Roseospira marina]MBB4313547.1 urease accessory protein [Roseospira marina]MBB5086709.1 urease accessory protein [Roseospira marina]